MCGMAGFHRKNFSPEDGLMEKMLKSMQNRGPDTRKFWYGDNIALGHSRLSIIDTTTNGDQPMVSSSGRYVLCCNGEIYNFREIKKELTSYSYPFKSKGDSEVLLAAIQSWGMEKTLESIKGMYAFSLWDREKKILYLVRDRMGEKPLYYGFNNGDFVFASTLDPIKYFCKELNIDRNSLYLYFNYRYVPSPYSIYKGIYKLQPGHIITFSMEQIEKNKLPEPRPYWKIENCLEERSPLTEKNACIELERLITNSVKQQMISDVPIGSYLSGGVDSSLVTAIMQKLSDKPVHTFSIGFDMDGFNEAPFAKEVATHIGTHHNEMYVNGQMCLDMVENIPDIYDEPFSDSSQIPTSLLARLAKKEVTVCLSGDGGDEVFGGYNRYFLMNKYWGSIQRTPRFIRESIDFLGRKMPPAFLGLFYRAMRPVLPSSLRFEDPSGKMEKITRVFGANNFIDFYKKQTSVLLNKERIVLGLNEPPSFPDLNNFYHPKLNIVENMMIMDTLFYLPNDILTKVDRACMAVSLETRVPLLDHKIVEFAWSLPFAYKIQGVVGKNILRKILYKYVPRSLIERPKRGFSVPLAHWIRGELKDFVRDTLSPNLIKRQGYIDSNFTEKILNEHLLEKRNWQELLWNIIVFQLWLNKKSVRVS